MKRTAVGATGVVIMCSVGLVGAIAQYGTPQPGQPTEGKVWSENKSSTDAAPIIVTLNPSNVVEVRSNRQGWEYQTLTVASEDQSMAALNREGAQGWEVVGVLSVSFGVVHYVLKRPR